MADSTDWEDWAGTMICSTCPLDPKPRHVWPPWSNQGIPATSPPLYRGWLPVGRHKSPESPKAG